MILFDLRRRIDDLDKEILQALNKRASIVKDIAERKKASGAPVHDSERVEQIIKRGKQLNSGPLPDEKIEQFFRALIQMFEDFENSV